MVNMAFISERFIAMINLIQAPPNLLQNQPTFCCHVATQPLSTTAIALVLSSTIIARSNPPRDRSANITRQAAKVRREVEPIAGYPVFRPIGIRSRSIAHQTGFTMLSWHIDPWGVYSVPAFGS